MRADELESSLQEQHRHFTGICSSLDKKSAGSVASTRASIAQLMQQQEAQSTRLGGLDRSVLEERSHCDSKCATLERTLTLQIDNQTTQMAADRSQFEQACSYTPRHYLKRKFVPLLITKHH